jgi:O-antigen/teichoic acid export membrane protein
MLLSLHESQTSLFYRLAPWSSNTSRLQITGCSDNLIQLLELRVWRQKRDPVGIYLKLSTVFLYLLRKADPAQSSCSVLTSISNLTLTQHSVNSKLGQLKSSLLAQNTLWMFLGLGIRAIIQAAYFVIIARSLGAEGLGAFAGVVALVSIVAPFASLGSGHLLIQNVARNAELFAKYWGNALLMTLLSGSILVGAVLWTYTLILPSSIPSLLVLSVAASDLLFARMLDVSGQAFQAFQRLGWTAQLQVLLSLSRLGAALGLALFTTSSPTPVEWGLLYLLSTAISSCLGVLIVHLKLGAPRLDLTKVAYELREGFYFSISQSSQFIHNDIDKAMLARLSTLGATGIYAAAYRIIDVSLTPVIALQKASYTRFFQRGTVGIGGSLSYMKRLLPYSGAYGLLVGVALYLTAPLLPYVLGDDYQDAVGAVRWLALLPFLKAIHYFVANTLTGAGFQRLRSSVQVLVVPFNVLLNLVLIPTYSWRGAAWASLASDALLLLALGVAVWYAYRKKQHLSSIGSALTYSKKQS